MHNLSLPSCEVILHNSPHTLPESQRVEHQYYHLIHSAVGSSLDDVDRHFDKQLILVSSAEIDDQVNAINNLRFLFANVLGKQIAPITLGLMCFVESIDELRWTNFSPDGVEEMASLLSSKGLTREHVEETSKLIYGKIQKELSEEFPKIFPDSGAELITLRQRILIFEAEELLSPDDPTLKDRRASIDEDIRQASKPPLLVGPKSQLKALRSSYDSNLISLQMEGLPVNERTTSLQFWKYYSALEARSKRTTKSNYAHPME